MSGATISCTHDVNFSASNACLTTNAAALLVNMNGNTFNWDGNNGSMGSATNPINVAAGTGTINVNGSSFTSYGNWTGSNIQCNTNPQTSLNGSVTATSSNTCSSYTHSASFAPTVVTVAASSITSSSAILNGTVSSNGASTQVSFNHGLSTAYGTTVTATQSPLASAASSATVSATLTGLSCGTTYFFRASATNSIGSNVGSGLSFTTSACATLVAEYRLDNGPWAGVSGEVKDTSGHAFNAVAQGASSFPRPLSATPALAGAAGTCGYANFAGASTGQGISVGAADLGLGGASGVSVSTWVRWGITPSSGNQWATIASNGAATTGQFMLQHSQTNGRFEFAAKSTANRLFVQSRTVPVNGTWYHLVGVYDGVGLHIYVNGVLDDNSNQLLTGTVTPYLSSYKFNIGMDAISARQFQGDIDELKVFSGALTPAQVTMLYGETHACANALVADYHLDELSWNGSAGEVKDSSSNGFHGSSTSGIAQPSTSGKICGAGVFNGISADIQIPNSTALGNAFTLASRITLSAWAKTAAFGSVKVVQRGDWDGHGLGLDLWQGWQASFRINGANTTLAVGSRPNLNQWYHLAATYDGTTAILYVNGVAVNSTAVSGTLSGNSRPITIGSAVGQKYFNGLIDEVHVFSGALSATEIATGYSNELAGKNWDGTGRTCAGPDHYELSLPTTSLACLPTTVTVKACANNSSPCTSTFAGASGATAALATSGATLGATSVSFNASGVATTTLTYPAAVDGTSVAVTLSGESIAPTNARQCCANGTSCSVANSCSSTFNSSGFIIASGAGGATANIATQTAGTTSGTYYLRAVQTNTSTGACMSALTGSQNVNWGYQCNNPTTCSSGNLMTLTGSSASAIASNPNTGVSSYTPVAMTFDANGNAPFTLNYADVGQLTLWVRASVNAATLSGSSNAFVTKPGGFVISSIKQTAAPALSNPAASGPAGATFVKAGESFSATVTATTSGGSATANYGRETTPEGVLLTSTIVAPSGGSGALSNGAIAGTVFSNGVATATNLNWSDVGIMTLNASVSDGDYLGAGNVTGSASANIGRFYPEHFDTVVTAHGCNTFTYSGQPLSLDITAKNASNAPTLNYAGSSWARTVTLNEANAVAGSITTGSNIAATSFNLGVASVTPTYTFTSRSTSPSVIKLRATETSGGDGVSSSTGVEAIDTIVSGRLKLLNAYGSERLDLPLTTKVEYYDSLVSPGWRDSAGGYTDSCTKLTGNNFAFATTASNCTTAVASCTSAVSLSATGVGPYQSPFAVKLLKPGVSSNGCVSVNLDGSATGSRCTTIGSAGATASSVAAPWLKYPWSSAIASNPTSHFNFGIYKSPLIYRRENY